MSKQAIVNTEADVIDIITHEAKYLQQVHDLGLINYLQQDDWKIEGIAEYARGKPTLKICGTNEKATENRLKYRENFVVTIYLIKEKGLTEKEIYNFSGYPAEEAERWIQKDECTKKINT